jgi:hypothetical protein
VHGVCSNVKPLIHAPEQSVQTTSAEAEHADLTNAPTGHVCVQLRHVRSLDAVQGVEKNEPAAHTLLQLLQTRSLDGVQAITSNDTPPKHGDEQLAHLRSLVAVHDWVLNDPGRHCAVQLLHMRSAVAVQTAAKKASVPHAPPHGTQTRSVVGVQSRPTNEPNGHVSLPLHVEHTRFDVVVHAADKKLPAGQSPTLQDAHVRSLDGVQDPVLYDPVGHLTVQLPHTRSLVDVHVADKKLPAGQSPVLQGAQTWSDVAVHAVF